MAASTVLGAVKINVEKMYPGLSLLQEQREAVVSIIEGHDTIVNLPVGSGKSVIFHLLPGTLRQLKRPHVTIVLVPLNAIIKDQMKKLQEKDITSIYLNMDGTCGKSACNNDDDDDDDVQEYDAVDEADIIFCHPEALLCSENGSYLLDTLSGKVGAICIDECHKIEEWGKEFRKSFSELDSLRSFFPSVPFLCLSGSLTRELKRKLPKILGLKTPNIFSRNPDVKNIFLEVRLKERGSAQEIYEEIFVKEIISLKSLGRSYPVTLLFLPLQYMSYAMHYAFRVFPGVSLADSLFGAVFSNQDADVVNTILSDLKEESPQFRLVFTTSVIGMGYDSPSVSRIIHAKPPRSVTNYLQEIGRAGRRGQDASAILYFSKSDIASNLPGIETDIVEYCLSETCLRSNLLKVFCYEKSQDSPTGCKCCSICKRDCNCRSCQ